MEKTKIIQWANNNLTSWLCKKDIEALFDDKLISCINNCKSPKTSKGVIQEADLKLIFKAFSLFKPEETRVLILGQDPYPSKGKNEGRADGLAFSQNGKIPAYDSLLNIFKAIKVYKYKEEEKLTKYFCDINENEVSWGTNLEIWAKNNGILLLNTALTHENKDTIKNHRETWEFFIQQVIKNLISCKLNNNSKLAVFLWGKDAQETFLKSFYFCDDKNLNNFLSIFKGKPGIIQKNNKFEFRESSFKLINEKTEITKNENIKIYMTSHPSNNYQAVKQGFCCNSPKHFESCDNFLGVNEKTGKYIWKNFPENNKE